MNFNKSIVATFVGAAISSVALNAVAADTHNMPMYKSFDNVLTKKQANRSNVATVSGMQNQFDAQLGKATFQWAQVNQSKPDLGAIAAEQQLAVAADFYLNKLIGQSSVKNSVVQTFLANQHDTGRGAKIAKYKQEVAGIEVFNREFNVMMDPQFNLVASSGYLADSASQHVSSVIKDLPNAFGDSSNAVNAAFAEMGGDAKTIKLVKQETIGSYEKFTADNLANGKQLIGSPRAKKVFFELKGNLIPAHYVELKTGNVDTVEADYYSYIVSAKTGEILFKKNLTSHAEDFNYRVYAEEGGRPWDSPHGNNIPQAEGAEYNAYLSAEYLMAPMVSLSSGPISTGDAWLADDATTTQGNNVSAYVDAIAPDGLTNGDYTAETTSDFTFDYSYDKEQAEYSLDNRKAAIVNLFYLNNYLHDDYYDHGFDEASGNAQNDNYGRGGEEGDALRAEVQDNSGFDNANMSTPADGSSPRMQMYLWETTQAVNGVDFGVTVSSHPELGVLDIIQFASFGPDVFEVSGDLVRIEDGTDPIRDGCEAAVNGAEIAGKIAIIDRGACNFTQKVKNAQDVGAIAVLIANNTDDGTPAPMGGADDTVTIPSMGINFSEGAAFYELLDANETVSISMFKNDLTRTFKASTWDNGIVAHEWGHYISNRLVGNSSGLSNFQGRAMGEGWGDFHALLLLSEEKDTAVLGNENYDGAYSSTSYVAPFTSGIRRAPYSTNMEINPLSFRHIESGMGADVGLPGTNVASPHAAGEVWAATLWDAFVALANDDSHSFVEAKNLMKDYLVAGYKMTPMAPTYTEARDAILAAAYANDVADYKLILAAFAKRGMGIGAISPDRSSVDNTGVVESFETDLSVFNVTSHSLNLDYEGMMTGYCSLDGILDKGETGTASFTVRNTGSKALSGVTGVIEVVSGHDVTFANDGVVTFGDVAILDSATSAPIEFTLNDAGTGDDLELKVTFPDLEDGALANDYNLGMIVNIDFEEIEFTNSTQVNSFDTLATLHDFTETVMVGGAFAKDTFGVNWWDAGQTDGMIASSAHAFESDVAYQTRTINIGFDGEFTIQWWHLYNLEADWDGAAVEISVNGGDWVDVTEMGGQFLGDGYTNTLLDYTTSALADRNVFSGINYGWETLSFGETLNGNQVQLRFRQSTDGAFIPPAFSGFNAGWYIDDMTFTNTQNSIFSTVVAGDTFACDNRAPNLVSISDTIAVNEGGAVNLSVEGSDPNGDALTYSWSQTGGIEVTITGADMADMSFTAPEVTGNQSLEFTATINDGTDSVSETVTVNVKDTTVVNAGPVTGNTGGGSTGWLSLLLLPLAMLRRRK
ncbi:rhombosortase-dependent M36 family metallopeptidase [Colwellia sp. 1_MG-2023]|uniref:rhombosortase-dependent M36 family metallopeptidase n=1 Tax=Colwellia sp. 1_MG-2023 TaxID=3062649 RepID=UPI0026E34C8D|nr:rhombosortase-dependent M36 family metallopeptidase [Colwellia sp. 1_MG-2023]MDO6445189.1 rhombosortase-dependent M36 family metallopeptidase [Colwellia sp. 1_MG-2023]